ncbi:MAG: DUF2797 domain-containing protein [Methanomassiliicoccales archaeon]
MFSRADRLLSHAHLSKQVVRFGWEGFEPYLTLYDRDSGELKDLRPGDPMMVSVERRCIGRLDRGYRPCPHDAPVSKFSQCPSCASVWIPHLECIFEPRCQGELCDSRICSLPHTVYVAFTGEVVKVGMTGSHRLRERGVEQGADAIAPLEELPNRYQAREEEKRITRKVGAVQGLDRRKAAAHLFRPLPRESVEESYLNILDRLEIPHTPQLIFLDGYPVRKMECPPVPVKTPGEHRGEYLGAKGRFMVYGDTDRPRMLDLSDLVSRFLLPL